MSQRVKEPGREGGREGGRGANDRPAGLEYMERCVLCCAVLCCPGGAHQITCT
jgi:hypothetical protein